ncbi:MAG TPA: glutamine-hydrolyzing GMP synthase, partial [Rectinemataceae bacterium]|nr:glutamine-hydrolyzing GMP synthase [Rectinemataceae bacterium]
MDTILILDYGSQYTQLIGRRIRELGVYADILPGDARIDQARLADVKGIILSGSPHSAYETDAPRPDLALYEAQLPVLGICYGIQRMTLDFGGEVSRLPDREYGRKSVERDESVADPLLDGLPGTFTSWMSHGDSISRPAPGFEVLARSDGGIAAALCCRTRRLWGLQFHPEVSHCEGGNRIIEN